MKKILLPFALALFLIGCSNAPVAMKSNVKYFTPIKTFAQKPAVQNNNKLISATAAKELSEKSTMIELLKKENQQLRERIARLEKHLYLAQS